jgi:hypothetical protein
LFLKLHYGFFDGLVPYFSSHKPYILSLNLCC